jgi:hypothetical protein
MPTYTIRNKKTGKTHDEFMSISEMVAYEKAHPEVEIMAGAPGIHSGIGLGVRKNDQGFKDVLRQIKKTHPRSTINTEGV